MFIRKIGKFVRGKATPAQIMMAAVLGCMLGFIPGFTRGPGLVVALTLLLVILNANLFVAAIAGLVGKGLSIVLMPVSFAVGRFLIDGPMQGLFAKMINAPVLALFGFEHYATTGGVAIGLLVGIALGLFVSGVLRRFRTMMMGLEDRSPRFVEVSRRWWVRVLAYLFIGPGAAPGKATYERLLQKKFGNPIRPLGVVLAVLVVAFLGVLYQFASEPILTSAMRRSLERANGATVDVGSVKLDVAAGRLTVSDLAMCDPEQLDRDLLRAATVEADVSGVDLLRKRVAIDKLVLSDAATGVPRSAPGKRIGPPIEPSPPAPPGEGDWKKLEDYVRTAEEWKERLARVREWLERVGSDDPVDPEERAKTVAERARDLGYASVRADHLIAGAPTFAVYELLAEGVRAEKPAGETLTIRGRNLSTQPHLLEGKPYVLVESSGGTFRAEVGREATSAAEAAWPAPGNVLAFHYRGIPTEAVVPQLSGDSPPLSGGTVDLEASGSWTAAPPISIDLPLSIIVHNSTLTIAGSKPTPIERLVVPVGVRGPLDNPHLLIDADALANALVAAGANELAARVRGEAQEKIDEAVGDLRKELGDKVGEDLGKGVGDAIEKGLGGLLGGQKDPKKDKGGG